MVESIVTVVVEVAKCLVSPTERRLGYLRNYNANFENLKLEIQKLKDESSGIQRRVSEAERNGEKIEEKVEKWLLSADKIIIEAGEFIADEETTNKLCLKGLCPDFKSRYQLSKKAVTELKAIVELREEAGRFDRISYRIIPEEMWLKSHKGYEAFESRLSTLNSIQKALTDLRVSMIGVYGMGGIGKTTLVKEVARQARDDKLFDQVVFSEVSQTPDIRKIQQEIAEKLGMELPDETESRRASRLYERLKKEKKILVVLDNTWKYLDLDTVGIPFGDDHKGCKLLLTSRDRDVLLSMGSKDNFSIGVLYEEEAWRLFRMMAGDDVENRKLKPTATDVAKACGGLPIALTTTARALRNKCVLQWKIALQELQTPSMVNFKGVPTDAYSTIELSFKYLQGEQLKRTLFLCSLFAPLSTKDLFKYGMGLGIFHGVHNMEYAHKQLYALVHRLKDSCLLLDGDSSKWLFMHDVVRDVAISIACRDQNAFVVRNEDLWGWPNEDALKNCYAICLRNNNIHELPQGLECPQLEFLYISSKDSSVEINIPESFFIGMRKLKVIDLTRMQLFSLPSSIDLLVNLQTLCLDQCMLGDIAIIGKLKNLEILSFLQSDIVQLPKELGQLTKLRLLDLTDCFQLKVIASNVISSLTRLEELYMRNCSIEWEVEGPNSERSNASLDELVHLPRLTTLEIDVKNDNILPEGFFARKLERFKISVGDASFLPPTVINNDFFRYSRELFSIEDQETFRTLKLKLISNTICSKKLSGIKNVEYLCLDKLQSVKNIIFELDMEGFSQLMHLHVQNNSDFLCIVESTKKVPCDAFPLLESLTLYNLINLERICHDRLRVGSFNELRTLKVEDCDQLCNIFLLSTAKCLPRLERIAVIDCSNMKAIFVVIEESDFSNNNAINKIEFAQLSSLSLGRLPELTGFCCEVKTPNDHLIILEDKLDSPTTLFNETVVLPKLEVLELCEINVEKIWHNQLPTMFPRFQGLTRLIVWRCQKLKCIFSASMVRSLEQLQHLEIYCCKALQVIISEEGADQVTPTFVFPHLTSLMLTILPELRCIYPAMLTSEWPVLKELRVFGCDQLDITRQWPLFLFEKIFPKLERLGLTGKDIRMFRQIDFPQYFFGNLKYLDVLGDDSASFPFDLLQRFHNLESLLLLCSSYKEILSNGGDLDKYVGKLAKIKYLELNRLNNLKQLWKQDSIMDSIFQYLENLHVHHCDSLLILLPSSSASFLNLTELHIFGCKELINLVTSSTAKSLARLVTMQVLGCRAMTEVILSEGDAAEKEEIVFAKLKKLSLVDLDSLTSFCSENYTFKFPSLEDLLVFGCPNMKTFTAGELSTPPRIDVWYCDTPYERRWDGDINTTIRLLHQQKLLQGSSSYSKHY